MTYEEAARRRKALRLAEHLRAEGILAEEAQRADGLWRDLACDSAGIRSASDETWAVALGILAALEAPLPLPEDLLDGVPKGPRA
jgi:hypothetical protein